MHYEKFADGTVKCIEDEIPFEVPEGWAWSRLLSLTVKIGAGSTPTGGSSAYNNMGIKFIRSQNVYNDGLDLANVAYISEELNQKKSGSIVKPKDILLNITGGSIGRCALIPDDFDIANVNQHVIIIRLLDSLLRYFVHKVIISPYIQNQIFSRQVGSGRGGLSAETLSTFLIPIPPHKEQLLMHKKLNDYLFHIRKLSKEKEGLVTLLEATKVKVLNRAIRGKLVLQNPDDEPASVLLEHIRDKKEHLIKEGKIKRDKKESTIFKSEDNSYYEKFADGTIKCIDEEIPFEIPDTWEWTRLKNCCSKEIKRGKSPKYVEKSKTLVFAQKCNTKYNGIDIKLALCLDENMLNKYPVDEYMCNGDIVINSTGTGTLGRVGYYQLSDNLEGYPIVPDSHITIIRACDNIHTFYLYLFMKANQGNLEKKGEGSTNQKELKPLTLKEILVPIPPYAEQKRIIKLIDSIFFKITAIEKKLS